MPIQNPFEQANLPWRIVCWIVAKVHSIKHSQVCDLRPPARKEGAGMHSESE